MHELLHALGFYHEQSRPDRDDYIRILWNNIIPDLKYNFNKATNGNMLNAPYDTCSLMHYGPMALSANGKPTIILKRNPVSPNTCPTIGNRNYLSNIDIRQLNTFYECKGYPQVNENAGKPTVNNCQDYNQYCPYYASYYPGFCYKYKRTCPKSCNYCSASTATGDCADKRSDCD